MKCTRSIAGNKNVYIYFHINLCVCIQTQLAKCLITISSHFKMTLSFDLLKLLRGQNLTKVISQIARDKHFYFNLFLIGFKSGLSKDTVHISDISKHQNKKMITILFWRFPPPKILFMNDLDPFLWNFTSLLYFNGIMPKIRPKSFLTMIWTY